MKKKQYIRFLFGLGLLGMAALLLSIAPAPSCWAGFDCGVFTECPSPFPVELDNTLDEDGDGFRNWFECCAASATYYDGSEIGNNVFNVNIPDVFVVVTRGDGSLRPNDLLGFVSQDPDWIRIHEIYEVQVGNLYDSSLGEFRRVSPGSMQRAVRMHLSSTIDSYDCPIPADLKIGIGNVGTTMDPNAGGTVYTRQIERKVQCLYSEAGYDTTLPEVQEVMQPVIDKYIKHTFAHELFHNAHLRYLVVPGVKEDEREYSKYEYHYSEKLQTIMAQKVVGSTKGGVVTLPIGTTFMEEDKVDAKDHLTVLVDAPQ